MPREKARNAEETGISYAILNGMQKIRLSGSEKRSFARWGRLYAQSARLQYNPPLFLKLNGVITTAISLVGTIILYYLIKSRRSFLPRALMGIWSIHS